MLCIETSLQLLYCKIRIIPSSVSTANSIYNECDIKKVVRLISSLSLPVCIQGCLASLMTGNLSIPYRLAFFFTTLQLLSQSSMMSTSE